MIGGERIKGGGRIRLEAKGLLGRPKRAAGRVQRLSRFSTVVQNTARRYDPSDPFGEVAGCVGLEARSFSGSSVAVRRVHTLFINAAALMNFL